MLKNTIKQRAMAKIIPIRLSHSALDTLQECERKFQLSRLLVDPNTKEESEHTVFGRAYGVGVATYMTMQDSDQAIFQAYLAYWPEIESDKKNQAMMVGALLSAFPILDTLLMEYEIAFFNGRPAVELSFRLDITDELYFVGYIDLVLRNRSTGIYSVWDAKSTGLQLLDLSPLYQYSGQVLGYSVALDRIVGEPVASYDVGFIVAQLDSRTQKAKKTHLMTWSKSLMDRLKWFLTLAMDAKRIEQMQETGHWPMRAHSCLSYNRPCRYFGTCHLHSLDVEREREEDKIKYDFHYKLDDLIQDHIARMPLTEFQGEI